jgi:hypothetical protein
VKDQLPKDVQNLDVTVVRFGRFTVRAYKRESGGAFSVRERRRMDRRRAEQTAGRPADGGATRRYWVTVSATASGRGAPSTFGAPQAGRLTGPLLRIKS